MSYILSLQRVSLVALVQRSSNPPTCNHLWGIA